MAELTLDSWVTADQHWEHPRIREYQDRPADHFELMHRLWCERVGEDDLILHLGDLVCFGSRNAHPTWLRGLPGRKLLIRGNHDDHTDAWYEAAGFQVLGRGNKPFFWSETPDAAQVAFTHEPDTEVFGWAVNVHGHIHANPHHPDLPPGDYRNVSVEVTGYAPVRLGDVLYGDAGERS